jgi:ABC-type antimicrobial peptide transport system permease subunit
MPVFLVRTPDQPMAVAPSVRRTLKELEPLRSVYDIAPLEQRIGDAFAQDRLRMVVLVLFATAALAMACVGVYGTLAYVISLRRREVGLRMALGALRRDVVRHFLLRALRVVVLACAVGIGISAALGRFLSGMLYGVSPSDPVTLSGVVAMVCVVAALAAVIPIARVAFVDPIGVLREE